MKIASWVFIPCSLLVAPLLTGNSLLCADIREEVTAVDRHEWVRVAQKLVGRLSRVVDEATESQGGKRLADWTHAERLIWQLWLITGNAPDLRSQGKLDALSPHHVEDYERFVNEHADLSEEQLHRRGLIAARRSFASPLCYATLQYVMKKTGSSTGPLIYTTPTRKMPLLSPNEAECKMLLGTYNVWLVREFQFAKWDSTRRQFRESERRAIDISDLGAAVTEIPSRR
jgi:hypothetical protein